MANTKKLDNVIRTKKTMSKKSIKVLKKGYIINPFTSRQIKLTGSVYKKIKTDIDDVNKFNANLKKEFLIQDVKELKEKVKKQKEVQHKRNIATDEKLDKYNINHHRNGVVNIIFYERIEEPGPKDRVRFVNGEYYKQVNITDYDYSKLSNKYLNKMTIRKDGDKADYKNMSYDSSEFTKTLEYLSKNIEKKFIDDYERMRQSGSVDAIYIMNSRELKRPEGVKKLTIPRMFKRNKINNSIDTNVIVNKYIKYNVNKKAEKFEDLFDINTSLCKYVNENYKANSCFINIIINTFYEAFEKKDNNGKRRYKQALTYPYLCALLNIENVNQDLGLTVNQSFKFFDKFNIGLDIVNNINECILRHRPNDKLNSQISPNVLRILIHNNHCIKIDKSYDAKISHLNVSTESDIIKSLWITNKYNIIKYDDKDDDEDDDEEEETKKKSNIYIVEYVDTIEDIFLLIKNNDTKKQYKFIYNDIDLNNLLYVMTTKHKVTPNVRMASHKVISIYIELAEVRYIILPRVDINESSNENNKDVPFDIIEYEQYQKEDINFYKKIFVDNHLSQYSEDVRTIENYYKMSPQQGYFTETKKDTSILNGVDICKAYTDAMMKIETIPIYGQFNRYRKYTKGEQIDALKMYIVKVDDIDKFENIILFHKIYNRVYGIVLLEAQKYNIDFNILYVRDYERLENVEYKQHIDILYQNEKLTKNSKKMIVNKVTGLLETKTNKRQISTLYNTYEEAEMYKYRYINEGKLTAKITPITTKVIEENKSKLYESNILKETEKTIYVLTVIRESENLINGFNQIKELIYCIHRIKMFEIAKICINAKMNIYGIKTDCLLLNNTENEIKKLDIHFDDNVIGAYRIELNKECNNKSLYTERKNSLISNISREINNIDIVDEYDTKEINEKITNRLLIIANVPGAGKSQIVKNYKNNDNKILFITPTRELALSLKATGYDSMTIYKFLGLNHKEQSINTQKDFYINQYNVICFEEIFQYKRSILYRIDTYISAHPNIKFIANGDDKQNEAIDDDETEHVIKYNDIIDMIFNNQMTLKISKRLTNNNDKLTLQKIKDDIFNLNIDVTKTIKKYFKTVDNIDDVRTEQNITYSNTTAKKISEHIHKHKIYDTKKIVIDNIIYYENMELVCRKSIRTKKLTLDTNYIYLLKSFNNNRIAIYEPIEKIDLDISITQFKECLTMNYARTGHSIQGRTIENDITIFDCDSVYVNRKWIWTALTRARKLENVTFYLLDEETKDILYECRIKLHFNILIAKLNKTSEKKYMIDDVYKLIDDNTNCKKCNCVYFAEVENGEIKTNTKIQIVNNNLNICCVKCAM